MFFFLVIGVNVIGFVLSFFVGGSWQVLGWAGLVFVMAVTIFFFFLNLVFIYIYIYIYIF